MKYRIRADINEFGAVDYYPEKKYRFWPFWISMKHRNSRLHMEYAAEQIKKYKRIKEIEAMCHKKHPNND